MTSNRARAGLRIPYEQNTKLIFIAQKMGVSKNAVILQAIREFLSKENVRTDARESDNG